jgi:MBOAT, membrane-bound O-acyltransferase family
MSTADVYERLVKKGKKAGFLQLLATQTVSAIWHVSFAKISN